MSNCDYAAFVRDRLARGEDPNTIEAEFDATLLAEAGARDWMRFGDGRYRRDYVCSVCGSWTYSLCGPKCTKQPDRRQILRSEWEATI